jgi:hypothetical protein
LINKTIQVLGAATLLLVGTAGSAIDGDLHLKLAEPRVESAFEYRDDLGMLEFRSPEDFQELVDQLERQIDAADDEFLSEFGRLSDDALHEYEYKTGYDTAAPLIEFERENGIERSMRQVYAEAHADWVQKEQLDPETDPAREFVYSEAEMTLLNADGEVKVGDSILIMKWNGFIEITDGDVDTLDRLQGGELDLLEAPNVVNGLSEESHTQVEILDQREVTARACGGNCKWWASTRHDHTYANKRKVVRRIQFRAWPWLGRSVVSITSYKKTWFVWVRYRTNLGVANWSRFYDRDCRYLTSSVWTGWRHKRRSYLSVSVWRWGGFPGYRIIPGQSVKGYFSYPGNSNSFWLY